MIPEPTPTESLSSKSLRRELRVNGIKALRTTACSRPSKHSVIELGLQITIRVATLKPYGTAEKM
jgi:hypothetical protein